MSDARYQIEQAIHNKNYDRFEQIINSGVDISQSVDSNNNTLLHILACHNWELSATQSVKSLFKYTPTIVDWIIKIRSSIPETAELKKFFCLQNDQSQTCMHIAITNENWSFANAILGLFYINYDIDTDLLRRDQLGLTEPELFLILYGIKGQEKQFKKLFRNYEYSIRSLKSASKAFKLINLNYEKSAVLPSTHNLYNSAIELDYPKAYAEIADPLLLEQVYEENDVVNPRKKLRQ